MDENTLLYNSRITRNYITFLKRDFPELDVDGLLGEAGISRYQVDDSGHWFSQKEVDRFQAVVAAKTGNPDIALEVGRNLFCDSTGPGIIKKYLLGLLDLMTVYLAMDKVYAKLSRAASFKSRKLGGARVEIVSRPKPGVEEKGYQCKNRLGSFQAIGYFFLGQYPGIEHPECLHEGGEVCRYILSWRTTPLQLWKRLRNLSLPLGGLTLLALVVNLPPAHWATGFFGVSTPLLLLFFWVEYFDKKALEKMVSDQGNAAGDLIEEINIRYNNALLVQGVGLSIVYGIVQEHQGEIFCYSSPSWGTDFVISLPGISA